MNANSGRSRSDAVRRASAFTAALPPRSNLPYRRPAFLTYRLQGPRGSRTRSVVSWNSSNPRSNPPQAVIHVLQLAPHVLYPRSRRLSGSHSPVTDRTATAGDVGLEPD